MNQNHALNLGNANRMMYNGGIVIDLNTGASWGYDGQQYRTEGICAPQATGAFVAAPDSPAYVFCNDYPCIMDGDEAAGVFALAPAGMLQVERENDGFFEVGINPEWLAARRASL